MVVVVVSPSQGKYFNQVQLGFHLPCQALQGSIWLINWAEYFESSPNLIVQCSKCFPWSSPAWLHFSADVSCYAPQGSILIISCIFCMCRRLITKCPWCFFCQLDGALRSFSIYCIHQAAVLCDQRWTINPHVPTTPFLFEEKTLAPSFTTDHLPPIEFESNWNSWESIVISLLIAR